MKQVYFLFFILLLASCQSEERFEQVEDDKSLSSQSELSKLISRLNQNPTAFDDFIDNSNSLSLEFPFEVTVNSEMTFSVQSLSDYQPLINELLPLSDDYTINVNFPVDVSLPNYEIIRLQNQSEFETVSSSVEGSSEINCLTYNFPLEINIFDADNGFTNKKTIQNKAQFFNLIENLKQTNGFYEITYPISISIEGEPQSISSNLDLNTAIENLDEDCYNPSFLTNNSSRLSRFIAFVTSGEFVISSYIDEGSDQTIVYQNFRFSFNSDHTILISSLVSGENFSGNWQAEIDDDELIFDISLNDNDLLDELTEDWTVEGFANPTRIILEDDDTPGENRILIFEKS